MTSRVKATITYNHPITVTKEQEGQKPIVLLKTDGSVGEAEIDEWFSGNQVIMIRETPKE